jgi:uncharacterized OB-fold protein
MSEYQKLLPAITTANRPFWDAAKRHELVAYKCLNCGAYYSLPTHCLACDNPTMEWVKVSGRGEVYTFGVYHQLYHPAWKEDIPYNVSWVKLEEGPILLTNIVGCRNEDIKVGMPVTVVFDDVTAEVTLPKFKPMK